jgi:hypothetical protein
MLRAVSARALASMSLAARAAARGSRGARAASLGAPRALAPRLVGGAFRHAPRSRPAWVAPRRGAFSSSRASDRRTAAATDESAVTEGTASSVYANPELYELAFGFRDFDKEAAFLASLCETHGPGRLRSLLELGAGPAWHSVSCVTTQGPCVAVALDNAPAMLARAAQRAREQRCEQSVAVVSGDMTAFDVDAVTAAKRALVPLSDEDQEVEDGFDLVTILLGTAAHLTDLEDAEKCLRLASQSLARDGLVVLELEHPFDVFDGQLMDAQGDAWDREVEDGDLKGAKVLVEWGREGDPFDVETQIVERTVGLNVVDGETGKPFASKDGAVLFAPVEEIVKCRVFTAPEIALLGKLAGLRVVATFGDMDTSVPLTHEDANNMVIVLKRKEDEAER